MPVVTITYLIRRTVLGWLSCRKSQVLSKAMIARGRFIEQKLLGLTRKIAPTSNDSETGE